jgi:hypothetical protein
MSWYQSNSQQSVEAQRKAAEEARKNLAPFRVFMDPGAERKLIYLDDTGFSFMEHTLEIPGRGWQQFTCLGVDRGCPVCQQGNRPYYVTLFTVIDTTSYVNKKGETVQNQKKIHALKPEAASQFFATRDQVKGLVGKLVQVRRGAKTDAASGNMFAVARDANDKQIAYKLPIEKEEYKPFDYARFYEPKPIPALRAAMGLPVVESGSSPVASSIQVKGLEQMNPDFASMRVDEAPSVGKPMSAASMAPTIDDSDVPF